MIIYTKDICPNCKIAKLKLKNKDIKFIEINIDDNPSVIKELQMKYNVVIRTVPIIEDIGVGIYDYFSLDNLINNV